jgi:predicted PurR-regulated permease PerM
MIIAVALFPLYQKLSKVLGGREKLAATLITTALILIIIGPCVFLVDMISQNTQDLAHKLSAGNFTIPAPTENVASWPLIGKPIFNFWQLAATNLSEAIATLAPQLTEMSKWLISSSVSTMMSILQLLVSVIVCGMLLINGDAGHKLTISIGKRLAGDKGEELTALSIATIRGVARGVLGVALIQSLLAGIGFFFADIPGAGILTILCLFVAIVQLPTFILLLPVIIYVFSIHSTLFATVFMVWMVMVGLLDNVLKPILMGRGIDLPMAVIFIGAIGGMMFSGIVGLFVGAIILALGYKLFLSWLNQ